MMTWWHFCNHEAFNAHKRHVRTSRAPLILLVIGFTVTMVCTGASSEKSPKPLSKEDVIRLLKGDVSPRRVADLARERKIDFQVTPEVEKELRQAGADDVLLEVLRQVAPKPVTPPGAAVVCELTLSGHGSWLSSVAWSPDGKRLATGSRDKTAKVWDTETGKEVLTLSGHGGEVPSVAWSPDGKRLATGSLDSTAKVWDAETGKEGLTLSGHTNPAWSVAWSPDGKRLATGRGDKTAKVVGRRDGQV